MFSLEKLFPADPP